MILVHAYRYSHALTRTSTHSERETEREREEGRTRIKRREMVVVAVDGELNANNTTFSTYNANVTSPLWTHYNLSVDMVRCRKVNKHNRE